VHIGRDLKQVARPSLAVASFPVEPGEDERDAYADAMQTGQEWLRQVLPFEVIDDAAVEIYGAKPSELRYLHVVLAQCGLPYREPEAGIPFYEKRNGRTSLILTPACC
jgi:hypothetical protein